MFAKEESKRAHSNCTLILHAYFWFGESLHRLRKTHNYLARGRRLESPDIYYFMNNNFVEILLMKKKRKRKKQTKKKCTHMQWSKCRKSNHILELPVVWVFCTRHKAHVQCICIETKNKKQNPKHLASCTYYWRRVFLMMPSDFHITSVNASLLHGFSHWAYKSSQHTKLWRLASAIVDRCTAIKSECYTFVFKAAA